MIHNTNDSPMDDIRDAVTRQRRENPFESSSVRNGRVRFIGGVFRVDSGGRVEIVGVLQVDGTTTVTGTFTVTGPMTVTGPWDLEGPGVIKGDVEITGKVTQLGDMDIDGVLTVNGDGWSITGDGEISGDVKLSGKVSLTGSLDVAEGGYIQVGPTRISGSAEGFISSLLTIIMKTPILQVTGALGVTQGAVFEGSVSMPGLVPITLASAPEGAFPGVIYRDASQRLRVVVPSRRSSREPRR